MIDRQDAWTPDNDTVLAETVLEHIRNGSTQLAAFEEVAERLERTPAACGFRWNSTVRKYYEKQIYDAKTVRIKTRSRTVSVASVSPNSLTEQIESVINWMLKLKDMLDSKDREIEELHRKVDEIGARNITEITVTEDYNTLLEILNRARTMGAISNKSIG